MHTPHQKYNFANKLQQKLLSYYNHFFEFSLLKEILTFALSYCSICLVLSGLSYCVSMDVCFSTSQMRPSEYQNVNQKKRQKKVVVGGDLYTKKVGQLERIDQRLHVTKVF